MSMLMSVARRQDGHSAPVERLNMLLRSSPVFFGRTYCPLCRVTHEWFAQNAWLCDSGCSECEGVCEQRVA